MDDTIFDFDKCAEKIMSGLFEKHSLKYTPEVFPSFKKINKQFWRRIEQGEIDRKYLTEHRFETVFAYLGIDFDGPAFEKEFCAVFTIRARKWTAQSTRLNIWRQNIRCSWQATLLRTSR